MMITISSGIHYTIAQEQSGEKRGSFWSKLEDTFIDRDIGHWSVRGLANFKDNSYRLSNDNYTLTYEAGNPSGIGVGLASSKLVLDLIINLKLDENEPTNRFDMQGDLLLGRTYVVFQLQDYEGYKVTNTTLNDAGEFRSDIESFAISLSGLHIFSPGVPSLANIFSGIQARYATAGTFVGGAYTNYHRLKADSSIISSASRNLFNEAAQITDVSQFGLGVSGGYGYFFDLPLNLMFMLLVAPGVGLSFKDVQTETGAYRAPEIWETAILTYAQLGYNGPRWYANLSNNNQWYFTSLGNGNRAGVNGIKVKLVVGLKFRKQQLE